MTMLELLPGDCPIWSPYGLEAAAALLQALFAEQFSQRLPRVETRGC